MKISIITLFPKMFTGTFDASIIKRARDKKLITIEYIDIRDFGIGKHKIVDDKPYSGGVGMILRVDVLDKAITHAKCGIQRCKEKVILLNPQGEVFHQKTALKLSNIDHMILVCGHYEGFDERVKSLVDMELSIGDYILTGGEIPAMVIIDAVVRLIPGVIEKKEATELESFSNKNLLEYPQYTRPNEYKDMEVPSILLSGNHQQIAKWKKEQAKILTQKKRPDLLN